MRVGDLAGLAVLAGGGDDLGQALAQLLVQLTLKIKVEPNEDGVTYTVRDDLKAKVPEADRGASLFFSDARGNLTRRDPRQPELPLRDASAPDEPGAAERKAM